MYFSSDSKVRLHGAAYTDVTLGDLLARMVALDEEARNPTLYSPLLSGGDQGLLLGRFDDLDAVLYSFKSGRTVTCATNARMILAGPGYYSYDDSTVLSPVLTDSGPDEIVSTVPAGKLSLVGVSARLAHAACLNGVWFLT